MAGPITTAISDGGESDLKRAARKWLGLVAVAILAAVGALGWTYWQARQTVGADAFHGFVLEPPQQAPELVLTDQYGRRFDLAEQKGRAVVLFFGYTNCPDVCPATLIYYTQVKRELGPLADRVRFAFVTVDPEYDTPERLREYVARFDSSFYGLWGSQEELAPILEEYGVHVEVVEDDNSPVGYWVNHTALSYVVDPKGRLRLAHPFGVEPKDIAADLRLLL
ncbi:MAG: SCO family protein [Firmicutes bacterium]|nr:SCO family protein [Bacillota bacterium]